MTDDADEIVRLAADIESANELRRAWTAQALAEARDRVAADDASPAGIVTVAGEWPVGIVGLVAGRLAEELGRPAVVFSTLVDPWRGSARSAGGFDLAAAFRACGSLFERHGGHAAAAGCHLAPHRFEAFRVAIATLAPALPASDPRPTLRLDLVARAESVDHVLLADLEPLVRTGDDPALIGIAGLTVRRVREANGGHTQMTLQKGRDVVDAICFGRADLASAVSEGDVIDVAARLTSRTFAGLETLQLEIRDVAPAGHLAGIRRQPAVAAERVDVLAGAAR
jgi:single-stranded-DNA-specific exonuclease